LEPVTGAKAILRGRNTVSTIPMGIAKPATATKLKKDPFAFRALLVFSFLYFARPEDVIPGLRYVPVAKIAGGIALLALIGSLMSQKGKIRFPLEVKLLFLLLIQMCISIPFAYWRGGAFETVFGKFSKGVIVAVLAGMLVETLPQLRKLLFVQAAAVSFMAISSILVHNVVDGRLQGAMGGIFENPNDLAVNIALNWPLCLAFLLSTRKGVSKVLWSFSLLAMLYVVYATYSRSGFLALMLAAMLCLWEFGIKGRRIHLVLVAAIFSIVFLALAPSSYYTRLASVVGGNLEGSMDRGSAQARRELLKKSLEFMAKHPLVGIGPGNFAALSGSWHVAHNTYTELGAEAGIPALILFLLVLWAGHRNLRSVRRSAIYKENKESRIFIGGLVASFGAYLLGALFADTAYDMFPYFLVAYTMGVYRIAYPNRRRADSERISMAERGVQIARNKLPALS
jgi:O-antigen ligase